MNRNTSSKPAITVILGYGSRISWSIRYVLAYFVRTDIDQQTQLLEYQEELRYVTSVDWLVNKIKITVSVTLGTLQMDISGAYLDT